MKIVADELAISRLEGLQKKFCGEGEYLSITMLLDHTARGVRYMHFGITKVTLREGHSETVHVVGPGLFLVDRTRIGADTSATLYVATDEKGKPHVYVSVLPDDAGVKSRDHYVINGVLTQLVSHERLHLMFQRRFPFDSKQDDDS